MSGGEITSMTERTTGPVTRLRLAQVFFLMLSMQETVSCNLNREAQTHSAWRKRGEAIHLQDMQ